MKYNHFYSFRIVEGNSITEINRIATSNNKIMTVTEWNEFTSSISNLNGKNWILVGYALFINK